MRTVSMKRAVIALAAAAALLAGCQGDGGGGGQAPAPAPSTAADNGVAALTPEQILQRTKSALGQAKSYRLNGDIADDGQRIKLDFRRSGADLAGSMAVDKAQVQLLAVGGQQYMKPNLEFWKMISDGNVKQAQEVAKLLGDRWAKVPADNKDFAELFSAASIEELLDPEGKLTKGEVQEIDGRQAVALTESGTKGGTLYVATTGEPYPVRLAGPTPADGHIAFGEFGATFEEIAAPDPAKVIDFEQLGR